MSNRNQGYNSGEGGRQQQGAGGGRQQRQNYPGSNSQQDPQQQSWPRQQQLPSKQGSWNRDDRRNQQRPQQGWQKNDTRRQQGSNQRPTPKQQPKQPPQKPREFKPPPPKPNAWGQPAAKPQAQSMPQKTSQQQASKQTSSGQQKQQTPPSKPVATSQQNAQPAATNGTTSSSTGAWGTKLNSKASTATAPSQAKAPPGRGQKVAPVILKPDVPGPPSKKAEKANKKENAKNNANSNNDNSKGNSGAKNIHGKKPKLSSINMGDLVPNIKKILPKDKNKNNITNRSTSAQTQIRPQSATNRNQPMDMTTESDFPALPTSSNWPSLAASAPPVKVPANTTPLAKAPAAAPDGAAAKKAAAAKQSKANSNNNSQSKKRKNQSQQAQDSKKGGIKSKNGSLAMAKPDEAHLAAAFFLPPGKALDPAHMQAQFPSVGIAGAGGGHDLMQMMKGCQVLKGRQRLKPRKKRFTALKRKILLERLRVWKDMHPEVEDSNDGNGKGSEASCTICVYGFASLEEVEDPDEYEELLENLRDMADKMGQVRHVFISDSSTENNSSREHPAFVHFSTPAEAMAARGVWDGLVIGGQRLNVRSLAVMGDADKIVDTDGDEAESAWRQACLDAERGSPDEAMEDADAANTFRILLKDVLTEDDLEDDECFAESIQDLKQLVEKFGVVEDVQSKKQEGSKDVVVVYKGDQAAGQFALGELQQLTLGGSQLSADILPSLTSEALPTKILLENVLTEDDLEDEECLAESLNDVKSVLEKFGTVASMNTTGTRILVAFSGVGTEALQSVATELNGTCLGGQTMKATVVANTPTSSDELCVMLRNLLTEDDLEDEDCLEESLGDVRELALQYGSVKDIEVEKGDDAASSWVKVTYSTLAEAKLAMKQFDGMIVGGETISAKMNSDSTNVTADTTEPIVGDDDDKASPEEDGEPKPMFSGDKRIPERFAACKRVPKVPNKGTPRNYAIMTNNDTVKPLLVEMLTELMRLQVRALHSQNTKNSKARRRVVIGLREVARGIRANKVKMVVMANNLDEYGAIDDKLQEILDLAVEKEVPVLFELSKRVLGKALGKKIKVSVCAVQATDGAHQQFVKLAKLAPHLEKPPSTD